MSCGLRRQHVVRWQDQTRRDSAQVKHCVAAGTATRSKSSRARFAFPFACRRNLVLLADRQELDGASHSTRRQTRHSAESQQREAFGSCAEIEGMHPQRRRRPEAVARGGKNCCSSRRVPQDAAELPIRLCFLGSHAVIGIWQPFIGRRQALRQFH